MRPLRPATDHRLGGPLPRQLANRPQPPPKVTLAGLCSQRLAPPGGYAVLARVSPGYPPLQGRSATCYSPVRHFTNPGVLLHRNFLVRLACVRHAASVDSEPGSNSRLKSARAWNLQRLSRGLPAPRCAPGIPALDFLISPDESGGSGPIPNCWNGADRSACARKAADSKSQVPTASSALTWHAQLSCQRAACPGFRPGSPMGAGPAIRHHRRLCVFFPLQNNFLFYIAASLLSSSTLQDFPHFFTSSKLAAVQVANWEAAGLGSWGWIRREWF